MKRVSYISVIAGLVINPLLLISPVLSAEPNNNAIMPTALYLNYVDSADMAIRKDKWEEAETYLVKALRTEPANKSNYLLWSNLGMVQTQLENYAEALRSYDIGLITAPKSTVLLNNRARTLLMVNRPDEALRDIDKALEIDSLNKWGLNISGLLHRAKGNLDMSHQRFVTLHNHFPDDVAGLRGYAGDLYINDKTDEAIITWRKALEIEQDSETWIALIAALIKEGKLNDAKEELRDAIREYPREPELYMLRSVVHSLQYQNQEAEADIRHAQSLRNE